MPDLDPPTGVDYALAATRRAHEALKEFEIRIEHLEEWRERAEEQLRELRSQFRGAPRG